MKITIPTRIAEQLRTASTVGISELTEPEFQTAPVAPYKQALADAWEKIDIGGVSEFTDEDNVLIEPTLDGMVSVGLCKLAVLIGGDVVGAPYFAVVVMDDQLPAMLDPTTISEGEPGEHLETWREAQALRNWGLSEDAEGNGYFPLTNVAANDEVVLTMGQAMGLGFDVVEITPAEELP